MSPCNKHEAQDVRESGAGFDCKLCEIERLRDGHSERARINIKMIDEIDSLREEVDGLRDAIEPWVELSDTAVLATLKLDRKVGVELIRLRTKLGCKALKQSEKEKQE